MRHLRPGPSLLQHELALASPLDHYHRISVACQRLREGLYAILAHNAREEVVHEDEVHADGVELVVQPRLDRVQIVLAIPADDGQTCPPFKNGV